MNSCCINYTNVQFNLDMLQNKNVMLVKFFYLLPYRHLIVSRYFNHFFNLNQLLRFLFHLKIS